MGKISQYGDVIEPKLSDKLIGTSVGFSEDGELKDPTYNFTLQQLLSLFLPNIPSNTLQGVLDYGNTATQDINLVGTITTTELEVTNIANLFKTHFLEEAYIEGLLFDSLDSSGTLGQVLSNTGSGVKWITPTIFTPTLQQVLEEGNTADIDIVLDADFDANNIEAKTITLSEGLYVEARLFDSSNSSGGIGQVLISLGSSVEWKDFPLYVATSPLSINPATKTISIQKADSTQNGYLSNTDWINFDGKQNQIVVTTLGNSGPSTLVGNTLNIPIYASEGLMGLTVSSPLQITAGDTPNISIPKATSLASGYLDFTDWNTFNDKQAALNGSGIVVSTLGVISYITDNSTNWNTAYNNMIVSAAVTGLSTKTLTLTQQDGGTITASWADADTGLTLVGLSMPSAFSVTNSPLTSNGTIYVVGSGTIYQYVDGTGALKTFSSDVLSTILTGFVATQGVVDDTDTVLTALEHLTANLLDVSSTGVYFFEGLTLDSTTTFSVGEARGFIVDNTTNLANPTVIEVNYPGATGLTDPNLTTSTETYVMLDSTGTLVLQPTFPTPQERRQKIFLGKLGHPDKIVFLNAFSQPDLILSPMSQVRDIWTPINLINGGVYPSANGANLNFNTSAGTLYGLGINFINNPLQPSTFNVPAQAPTTFRYRTQTGGTSGNITLIDPTKYDVNGTITTISGAGGTSTNQRIYCLQNGQIRIQYGQQVYNSLAEAVAGIQTESFVTFPNFIDNAILIGILSVTKNCTDLTDTNKAKILLVSKFGESIGSAGGVSTTTLQQAYNNSIQPEIVTNSTLGAVTLRRGSVADTDNVLEIQNGAGLDTAYINGLGDITANSFIKTGGTASQFLKANGGVDSNPYIMLSSLSAVSPLVYNNTTGVFSILQAGVSSDGYLSSTDWNTFNNKQAAGNYITSLIGEASATGPGAASVTLNNGSVIAKVLTGLNITGGSVISTDTILTAFGKIQNQINGLIGGSIYQGTWNANTNTPALASGVGTNGYYYIVNVAGSTNLDGITDWNIGDWAIFDGTAWQQVDNTDSVVSVNGEVGIVNLTTDNIPQGVTNLYFANSLARAALSFTPGSGAYNNTTGVITIPTNTNQLTNGASFITLASLSVSSPLIYNNTTGAFSIQQANSIQNGYLSSTDWNTFNNKQGALTLTTSGTSGAATLIGNTLNIPNYAPDLSGYVPTSRILTINGTTYDLAANRSWSVGTVTSVGLTSVTSGVTIGSSPITTSGNITLTIATASGSQQGLLSAADWTTFNNKQNALTNPVTGTGTTNFLAKFSSASNIGNSIIYDNGVNVGIGTTSPGQILHVASASSPRIVIDATTNGNNSGLYFLTKNTSGISQAGGMYYIPSTTTPYLTITGDNSASHLNITSTGNVGIGTISPSYKLDVNGSGGTIARFASTDNNLYVAYRANGTDVGYIGNGVGTISGGSATDFGFQSTNNTVFATGGGAERMRITAAGNVGIGTSSPSYKFQTAASVNSDWVGSFYNTSTTSPNGLQVRVGASSSAQAFGVYTDGIGYTFNVLGNGNVGIGTTAPSALLDVNGSMRSSTLTLGQLGLDIGGFNFYSQTISGAMGILGHNVRASSTVSNQVNVVNSGWYSSMIRQYYSDGITFHTSQTSYAAGSVYPMDTTERMRITAAGEVLIGTTSSLLAASGRGTLEINGTSSSIMGLKVGNSVGGYLYSTSSSTELYSTNNLIIAVNGAERMRVASNGNVAIGDTTGAYKFYVNGGQYGTLLKGGDLGTGSEIVKFAKADNSLAMFVRGDGNVGIATSTPSQLLQVGDGTRTGSQYSRFYHSASDIYIGQSGGVILGIAASSGGLIVSDNALYPLGIGTIGAQPLIFGTSNNERMRITSDGNVGIGTTSPLHKLSVVGKIGADIFSDSYLEFNSSGNTILKGNNSVIIGYAQTFTVTSSGNVGIGTVGPAAPLDVNGTILSKGGGVAGLDGTFGFGAVSTSMRGNAAVAEMYFYTANSEKMRITATGAVGIGTTSPAPFKLSVNGTIGVLGTVGNPLGSYYIDHPGVQSWKMGVTTANSSTLSIGNDLGGAFANKIINLTNAGNVGIGTISPSAKLTVIAPFTSGIPAAYIEEGEFNQVTLRIKNTNGSANVNIFEVANSSENVFTVSPSGAIKTSFSGGSGNAGEFRVGKVIAATAVCDRLLEIEVDGTSYAILMSSLVP